MKEMKKTNLFRSPVLKDVQLTPSYDENGNTVIEFKEVNYSEEMADLGVASDWSLDSMLKAGISPEGSIHTGSPGSRLDNYSQIGEFAAAADEILNSEKEDNNN